MFSWQGDKRCGSCLLPTCPEAKHFSLYSYDLYNCPPLSPQPTPPCRRLQATCLATCPATKAPWQEEVRHVVAISRPFPPHTLVLVNCRPFFSCSVFVFFPQNEALATLGVCTCQNSICTCFRRLLNTLRLFDLNQQQLEVYRCCALLCSNMFPVFGGQP